EDILLITNEGIIIRFEAKDISRTSRDTQGVRLMRLDEEQFISTLSVIDPAHEETKETIVEDAVTRAEEKENDEEEGERHTKEAIDEEAVTPAEEKENDEEELERPTEVDELIERAEEDTDLSEDDLNNSEKE